jgi:catechol 2,3-dioxygenase-like lactoylglutathione lyase family enzyme
MNLEIEHFALNVPDPVAMARWYAENCGMRIARSMAVPPFTHFLVDAADEVAIEIYKNPAGTIPDYAGIHPLQFHFAMTSEDPASDAEALVQAGARIVEQVRPEDGSYLIMLRDPWDIPIQLCRRAEPFV